MAARRSSNWVEGSTVEARIGIPADRSAALAIGSSQTLEVGQRPLCRYRDGSYLPELDSTSRTVTAVLQVETSEPLTIGQTARLVLADTQPANGFWVPSTALVQGERGAVVHLCRCPCRGWAAGYSPSPCRNCHTEGDRVLVQGMVQPGDAGDFPPAPIG